MASCVNERIRFMHIPKTGGTWAEQAMLAAGVELRAPTVSHPMSETARHYSDAGHPGLAETVHHDELFTFAFVRHPLAWWRSFWGHRMREGWIYPEHEIDSRACSDDFEEFLGLVAAHLGGFLTELFARYTGAPEPTIDFVGRQESIGCDLRTALVRAGQPFDEVALLAQRAANVGDLASLSARVPRRLAVAIVEAEGELVRRYYGDDPLPAWMLR
jgi:hypothetical protein